MQGIYLPLGCVVEVVVEDRGSGWVEIEDFVGHAYRVRSELVHLLCKVEYEGIC